MLITSIFSYSHTVFKSGKRRKCWLSAFPLDPTMFSKAFVTRIVIKSGLCGNLIKCLVKYIVGKQSYQYETHIKLNQNIFDRNLLFSDSIHYCTISLKMCVVN